MNDKGIGTIALFAIGIIVVILFCGIWLWGTYNGLVDLDTSAENAKSHVQSAYQRRADLLPELVNTTVGAANFEKSTQTEIAALRSQAGSVQTQMQSAQSLEDMQKIDATSISGTLSRLMVVVEAYPTLQANQNFLTLQSQIEGTENRINYERNNYNDAVKNYKNGVRQFPAVMIAGQFGFSVDKWNMFEALPASQNSPPVDFSGLK